MCFVIFMFYFTLLHFHSAQGIFHADRPAVCISSSNCFECAASISRNGVCVCVYCEGFSIYFFLDKPRGQSSVEKGKVVSAHAPAEKALGTRGG